MQRLLGETPSIDGGHLAPEVGLGLRVLNLTAGKSFEHLPVEQGRTQIAGEAYVVASPTTVVRSERSASPAAQGPLAARLYRPLDSTDDVLGCLDYFQGGGWVLGDLNASGATARSLCTHTGIAIVSVDCRLAPEDPFPPAIEDALSPRSTMCIRAQANWRSTRS